MHDHEEHSPIDHEKNYSTATERVNNGKLAGPGAAAQPRGGKFKRFLKKWWWLLLIIFIVCTLAIVLPLIFVGIPNIAQGLVNKSTLDITNQVVSNPTPSAVDIQLTSVVKSGSSFHPNLGAFDAALFLENTEPDIKPFGYVTIPPSKVSGETTINVSQNMVIADMDQFKAYTALVLKSETFRVAVRGRVSLKQSGLKAFDVDYNKAVAMKGLNGLSGLTVSNLTILTKVADDGTNMIGTVFIPNPSVMTVSMGNVTLDLSVDGQAIGTSLLPDLTLRPGDNTLEMRSNTNQSVVLGLITKTYKNGILPIDIIGNSSINAAGEHLEYFEAAIQNNPMSISLDVGPALAGLGINITDLNGGS